MIPLSSGDSGGSKGDSCCSPLIGGSRMVGGTTSVMGALPSGIIFLSTSGLIISL